MKVRTNLSPSELDRVSKGLKVLADKDHGDKFITVNAAEERIDSNTSKAYDFMVKNLVSSINNILKD